MTYCPKAGLLILAVTLLFSSLEIQAQQRAKCGTPDHEELLKAEHPEWVETIEANHEALNEFTRDFEANRTKKAAKFIIPVVFHVVHANGPENISDLQILDAMRIINEDFNNLNADIVDVNQGFSSVLGNAEIEFRLAKKDPSGDPTSGIDRIPSSETFIGDDGSKLNPWPREDYLNIWVTDEIAVSNAAAYAYRPAAVSLNAAKDIDGIITNDIYVGSIGTGSQTGFARTLTHEIGHYLNLSHTWGGTNDANDPSNCFIDDEVSDTPNTEGNISGCNQGATSCGSLDNIQNYMDYSDCPLMFTSGQVARMHAALNSGVADRNELSKTSNLANTGVSQLSGAEFSAFKVVACQGEDVQLYDHSYHGQTSWEWRTAGTPFISNEKNPVVQYHVPGLKNLSLEVGNGTETVSTNKNKYLLIAPLVGTHPPFTEGFESGNVPNKKWYPFNVDNDAYKWILTEDAASSGSRSLQMLNFNADGYAVDEFYSSSFDLTPLTNAEIKWKMAYAKRISTDNDALSLQVTHDCGETWIELWGESSSDLATASSTSFEFIPGANDWVEITQTLPAFTLIENFRFKFVFEGGGGNNLFIDDINIEGDFDPVPVLEYPPDASPAEGPNTVIDWKAVGGVDAYEYQIDDVLGFTSPNLQEGTTNYISEDPIGEDTEFAPQGLVNGRTYFWRVRSVENGNPSDWSEIWQFTVAANGVGVSELLSESLVQLNVFPNPTNDIATVRFYLPEDNQVQLRVYDVLGRQVSLLTDSNLSSGDHSFDLRKSETGSGLFFVKLHIGNQEFDRKVVVE